VAGAFRPALRAPAAEVEFRDGIHGLIVWGLAVLIGAALALALPKASAPRSGGAVPTASNGEPFLASDLDRLLVSDQKPGAAEANDNELQAQAARIIFPAWAALKSRQTTGAISCGRS
jgi:hypothetical protein